jgi:hypothetical protein
VCVYGVCAFACVRVRVIASAQAIRWPFVNKLILELCLIADGFASPLPNYCILWIVNFMPYINGTYSFDVRAYV